VGSEAAALLKLGFAFMASALMMTGAAFLVRLILTREIDVEAAGYYQAAWTLGGLYVAFILQAMGADFYPRLTGVAKDNAASNRMVNEQAQVSLLLAGPGVIATLTLAPFVIALFYSEKFGGAVEVLRWICLGMALRIIIWPIGFIILAKGAQAAFFWTELAWTFANVGLTWVCVQSFGVKGAGIAFFVSYLLHGTLVYFVVQRLSEFHWSRANAVTGLYFIAAIAVVFCCFYVLPPVWAYGVGALTTLLAGIYSLRMLLELLGEGKLPKPLRRLFSVLKLRFTGP
jgi:PST family polysaccharide transporter